MPTRKGKVAIIGAGAVGTTFAYAMQIQGVASEIVLVNRTRERAEAEVLDMNHGLFFTPPVWIHAGSYEDCAEAELVAITAGAKQKPGQTRLDLVRDNVVICKDIVERVVEHAPDAILMMVTNPVDVLTYAALKFSGLPRERVMGSGTVLDSARFRYLLSERFHIDPHNVHAYVLGEHGDSEVAAWSMTHIAGMHIDDYCSLSGEKCDENDKTSIVEQVRDSAYHIIDAKGATNYAVDLAMVKVATSILRNEHSVLTVSTLLDGEFGIEDVCLGAPAVVNSSGAERVLDADLTEQESTGLRASADSIKQVLREVGLQ